MELIWAVVAQEDNGSYDGALAVITPAMSRTESSKWAYCGSNALSQLMAPGQFCYSVDSYWKARLGGNVPDYVKQAVYDCLTGGVRNHTHTSFRSTIGKERAKSSNAVQDATLGEPLKPVLRDETKCLGVYHNKIRNV